MSTFTNFMAIVVLGFATVTVQAQAGPNDDKSQNEAGHSDQTHPKNTETAVADPIYPESGELRLQKTDLSVPSLGMPFMFERIADFEIFAEPGALHL